MSVVRLKSIHGLSRPEEITLPASAIKKIGGTRPFTKPKPLDDSKTDRDTRYEFALGLEGESYVDAVYVEWGKDGGAWVLGTNEEVSKLWKDAKESPLTKDAKRIALALESISKSLAAIAERRGE